MIDHLGSIKLSNGDQDNELFCVPESNGGLPVNLQDQTITPIDSYFSQAVSNFTLSAATGVSTVDTLITSFEATAGHGITTGKFILLLDVISNRSFEAKVVSVSTNTIGVDRPIDHNFPTTTLGRIIIRDMAVNGGSTAQIFSLRAGSVPLDFTKFKINITDGTEMDDSKFGGIAALTKGVVFRIVNGFQKTVFNFKSNSDIILFSESHDYSDKAPAGKFGFSANFHFAGQGNHGVALRISTGDVLQVVIQDDLTDLETVHVTAIGHEVTD